jgi:hypothetical protein
MKLCLLLRERTNLTTGRGVTVIGKSREVTADNSKRYLVRL